MKHFLLFVVASFITVAAVAQNNFRSRQDGDWEDTNTWEEFNGSSWQNTANIPDVAAGNILIESFTTVTINADITLDEVLVGEDASLVVAAGATVTLADGTGTDLEVTIGNGTTIFDGFFTVEAGATLINQGTVVSSSLNFSLQGEYEHAQDGGAIPEIGWSSGSVLKITGIQNTPPSNVNGPFYDFIWDNASQASSITLSEDISIISHDLIIENTNGQVLELYGGGTAETLGIGNNLVTKPGTLVIISSNASFDVTLSGMLLNEGTLTISGPAGNASLHVSGDIASSGVLTSATSSILEFEGTDQIADITTTSGEINYQVAAGTALHLNESILSGIGSFTTGNNVDLYLGSLDTNGALQLGSGGNIQVPGANRTYGNGTQIIYEGSVRQYIGDGHPAAVPMIIENPQGVELAADVTLDNALALSGGSLYLNSNSLSLSGTLSAAGGFYIYPTANSSIYLTGSGDLGNFPFPPTPQTVNNLQLDRTGPGGVDLVTDLTVKGNLLLDDGTLDISDYSFEIEGDIVSGSGDIRTNLLSDIIVSGSGAFGGIPFADATNQLKSFTLARSGASFTPGDDLVIFELLELRNGTFDNTSDRILLLNDSEIIRHSNALLTGVHPGLFSGNYHLTYMGGSITAGPELPGAGIDELGDLTIEGGPVTISNDLIINGDVALVSGGIFAPTVNFIMRGSSWDQDLGTFSNDNGQVTFESTTAVTSTDAATFNNVMLTSGSDVTFDNIRLSGDLNINAAATVLFNNALQLTGTAVQELNVQGASINDILLNKTGGEVNITSVLNLTGKMSFIFAAVINTNDNLVVKAGTDPLNGGSIQIIPPGSSINGSVTVERFQAGATPTGIDVYLGSAVSDADVAQLQDDFDVYGAFTGASPGPPTPSLYYYDETQSGDQFTGFMPYPTTANTELLNVGTGYKALVKGNGDMVIDVTGTVNQGQIAIPVTLTDTGMPGADGWNLVANPYPAPIGWDQLGGWDKASVNNMIVLELDGRFLYWNGTGAGNSSRTVITNGVIPAGHTFWVQASQTGNLIIEESAKIDAASPPVFADPSNQLIISLENGSEFDEAVLAVWPDATNGFDAGLDAVKLDNQGFDISTKADDGTPLALNYIEPFGCQAQIDIQMTDMLNGTYTISFSELTSFTNPYDIILRDNFLTMDIDVRSQNSYDFTVDETNSATFTDRFQLIFSIDLAVLVNTTIDLQSNSFVCPDTDATVIMNTTQPGITYQAYLNGVAYGNTFTGTGQTAIIDIPAADLSATNTFKVSATAPACGAEIDLLETITITRTVVTPQIVESNDELISNYPVGNEWYFGGVLISTADRITPTEEGIYTLTVTQNGCQASATLDFKIVAGVDEEFSNAIAIAPNPASDHVRVYLPDVAGSDVQYELIGLTGSMIKSGRISLSDPVVSLSGVQVGVYILRIITPERTGVKRILISQ